MLDIPGHSITRSQDIPSAQFGLADAHFLRTLGIPLVRGRDFADSDSAASAPVVLISRELKRRYFPKEDPIGRKIHIGPPQFLQIAPGANITDSADVTIIGIVGDFKNAGLALPPEPQITVLYGPIRKLSARVLASRGMSIPPCVGQSYGFVKMYPKQTESGAIGESAARDYRKRKEV
jgi:hypothetical protein